jgi:Domain of unknown function (DUF4276)
VKIAILVEGKTEKAFIPLLRAFLQNRLPGHMPKLDCVPCDGRLPTSEKLKRIVERLLDDKKRPADAVIALTDVYTGGTPPDFIDATDAKNKMRQWVGDEERFFPHAAQYEFEAWLLPYWDEIQKLAGSTRSVPSGAPETVNHLKPPAYRINEVFRTGLKKKHYIKSRDGGRILRDKDLTISAKACPELKSFLNTILTLCEGQIISAG